MTLPAALKAALEAQLQERSRALAAGATSVGWKVAESIPGVDSQNGAKGSIFGYLTTDTVRPADSHVDVAPYVDLCAEVELGIHLRKDVPAEADWQAAHSAVAGITVALEIVDVDAQAGMHAIVAQNVFHRAVAFGPAVLPVHQGPVLARLSNNGHVIAEQSAQIDPFGTVLDMARLLGAFGLGLCSGDRIIAGSLIHAPVEPGHRFTAAIQGLEETSLYLSLDQGSVC